MLTKGKGGDVRNRYFLFFRAAVVCWYPPLHDSSLQALLANGRCTESMQLIQSVIRLLNQRWPVTQVGQVTVRLPLLESHSLKLCFQMFETRSLDGFGRVALAPSRLDCEPLPILALLIRRVKELATGKPRGCCQRGSALAWKYVAATEHAALKERVKGRNRNFGRA